MLLQNTPEPEHEGTIPGNNLNTAPDAVSIADETAWRERISQQFQAGKRDLAMQEAFALLEHLDTLGQTPQPETQALLQRLTTTPTAATNRTHVPVRRKKRRSVRSVAALAGIAVLAGGGWLLLRPSATLTPRSHSAPVTAQMQAEELQIEIKVLTEYGIKSYAEGDYLIAADTLQAVVHRLRPLAQPASLADVLANLGKSQQALGDLDAAIHSYDEALALRRTEGNALGIAYIQFLRAGLLQTKGDLADARKSLDESLTLRTEAQNRGGILECLRLRGALHQDTGAYTEARADFEQALTLSIDLKEYASVAACHGLLGTLHSLNGRHREARAHLYTALKYWKMTRHPRWIAATRLRLAQIELHAGGEEQAQQLATQALELYRVVGDHLGEADARLALARTHLALDNANGAEINLRAAQKQFEAMGAEIRLARAALVRGNLLHLQGRHAESQRAFTEARKYAVETGYVFSPAERTLFL